MSILFLGVKLPLKVSDGILDKIDSKIIETLTGQKESQREKVLT